MGNLSILRGALPSAQVSSYTTGSITLPSARGAFAPPTDFESIASVTPSGVSTVTFSSIAGTYKSLQIRGLCSDAGVNTLTFRMNGVTTSSYTSHTLETNGTATSVTGGVSQTSIQVAGRTYGLSDNALYLTGLIIDIHDYASTTKNKTVHCFNGFHANGAPSYPAMLGTTSGFLDSTSAITSITLFMPSNYSSGTTFALYGIK